MRNLSLFAVALVVGCEGQPSGSQPPGEQPDAATDPTIDAAAPDIDALPAFDPTDGVEWFAWPEQQPALGQAAWGVELTDVARHIPASYGDTYWFDEAITASHETTHGIQAHLRNYEAPSSIGWNAFYVLGNKAAFVKEPAMRKADIKPHIPTALRGDRYDLYLEGQTEWDDTPLYVFDEWTAYLNGAEVGVGQVQASLYTGQWTDAVMGPLEFSVYAIATAKAVAQKDPAYFASNAQFKRFTAWNIKRAMHLFDVGRAMTQFEWDKQDMYATTLRTGPEAEALRTFARDTWGATWTQTVLGF